LYLVGSATSHQDCGLVCVPADVRHSHTQLIIFTM